MACGPRTEAPRLSELLGTGAKWANPSKWLEKALRAAGRAPAEAAAMMAQLTEVFGTEPAVKLAAYDEAKRLYTQVVRDGRKDLEVDLAMLCETKAALQFAMGDVAGADQERDQVVAIVERLAEQEGRLELSSNLANAYASKSIAVRDLGDSRGAVALYCRTISLWEPLVVQAGGGELASQAGWTLAKRGETLLGFGEKSQGLRELRSTRARLQAAATLTGSENVQRRLAQVEALLAK